MKILVTGASGNVGGHVVRALTERGMPVRAFVRDRDKAARVLGPDVELAVGDFADRGSIERALSGADRLFLACGNVRIRSNTSARRSTRPRRPASARWSSCPARTRRSTRR